MVTQLFMKRWFGWHKILAIVICSLMVMETLVLLMVTAAAAMRYTEARMSKISMELLRDINKDTIDYQDNYDGKNENQLFFQLVFQIY